MRADCTELPLYICMSLSSRESQKEGCHTLVCTCEDETKGTIGELLRQSNNLDLKQNGKKQINYITMFQVKNQPKINSHDTSQGPDVRFGTVALPVEHLWGQVIGSPTDCSERKTKDMLSLIHRGIQIYFCFAKGT